MVDALDARIVRFFTEQPRASVLEASRVLGPDLQRVLDAMIATKMVRRASSVIVLNTHFQGRTLNLLEAAAA